jgi:3-deoxy-manno-octulosonate cytidylyltransferase (CMP-KDO synthetase)
MQAVIVIPARWASTRFPGKPLVMIAGRSLVERVWLRAAASRRAVASWVATDDSRIADHVRAFGGQVVMPSGEFATGTDRIAASIDLIAAQLGSEPEQIVNIQGDEPLIDIGRVDAVIDALRESDADIATLAAPVGDAVAFASRDVVKVVCDLRGFALYFSRAPIPWDGGSLARRHIGVYGFQTAALRRFAGLPRSPLETAECLEQLRALQNGFKIKVLDTTSPHLGVDRPEDVARVEDELARLEGDL